VGINTGLRVEEINVLEFSQLQGKHLKNVHRTKSGKFQDFFLDKPVRDLLTDYIKHERGTAPGPLFVSKSGQKLAQSDIYTALKRMAAHANASLPEEEQINIHPHLLRHTFLRRVSDREDIRAARAVSGLKSDKYLWRYTQLTQEQVEKAVTGLYDD
jgi:integrase/recombinase XerD